LSERQREKKRERERRRQQARDPGSSEILRSSWNQAGRPDVVSCHACQLEARRRDGRGPLNRVVGRRGGLRGHDVRDVPPLHPSILFFFFRRETYLHSPSILDSDNQTELSHAFFYGNIRGLMLVLIVPTHYEQVPTTLHNTSTTGRQ
jgi:hypothetical protein